VANASPRVDVFLAYANEDRRWARRLSKELQGSGVELLVNQQQLAASSDLRSEVERAVERASHLVVLWSARARESQAVRVDLERFLQFHGTGDDHRVIQIALDDTAVPFPDRAAITTIVRSGSYEAGADGVEERIWSQVRQQVLTALNRLPAQESKHSEPPDERTHRPRTDSELSPVDNDYAIVIGIASYPNLRDLPAAALDAHAFVEWLRRPDGAALPHDHIWLTTFQAEPKRSITAADLEGCFAPLAGQIVERPAQRIGRRLYLFASGRGTDHSVEDLALCAPAASLTSFEGIRLKSYADWFVSSGAFDEVLLLADCRPLRTFATVIAASAPFAGLLPVARRTAFLCCASKTVDGARDAAPEALGPFTQALLEALNGAAGASGSLTSSAFVRHMAARVPELSSRGQDAQFVAQGPEFVLRGEAEGAGRAAPDVPAPAAESVAAHADNPALVDELGRRPFADIIAARIEEVRASRRSGRVQEPGAFMVNLHGPWGAGKTSVLNFLKANLQDQTRPPNERWVVIEFNAWRSQRLQPPWWTLIKEIKTQAAQQLGLRKSVPLRTRWFLWRCRVDWMPSLITAVLLVIAVGVMSNIVVRPGAPMDGDDGVGKAVELGLGVIAALLATGGAIVAFSRSMLFGSSTAAQAYVDAKSDPLGPIIPLFRNLVNAMRRPVVVFIDDLDRCECSYVISLLEGIQTLFRGAVVTYVVAADRKWICSCFEERYADFADTIGEPGRPLGYLFLDKVFQVSAAVPRLSLSAQRSYWEGLLKSGAPPTDVEEKRKTAEQQAQGQIKDLRTKEQFDQKIQQAAATGDPVTEQAMRAAVAKQITSPEVLKVTEHRLRLFADLVEPNPRAMKRLVNAYGMYQAAHILERRNVSPEALARWTLLELRWPVLADYIRDRPELLRSGGNGGQNVKIPKWVRNLLADESVKAVLTLGAEGRGALSEEAVREIVGNLDARTTQTVNATALQYAPFASHEASPS
jgi:hypothetical protein